MLLTDTPKIALSALMNLFTNGIGSVLGKRFNVTTHVRIQLVFGVTLKLAQEAVNILCVPTAFVFCFQVI